MEIFCCFYIVLNLDMLLPVLAVFHFPSTSREPAAHPELRQVSNHVFKWRGSHVLTNWQTEGISSTVFFISAAEVIVPIYNFRPNLLLKCVLVLGLDFGKLFSYPMIYSKVMFITTVIQSLSCNDLHFQLNAIRAPKTHFRDSKQTLGYGVISVQKRPSALAHRRQGDRYSYNSMVVCSCCPLWLLWSFLCQLLCQGNWFIVDNRGCQETQANLKRG